MCSGLVPLSTKNRSCYKIRTAQDSGVADLTKANFHLRIGTVTFLRLDRTGIDSTLNSSYTYSNSPEC